MTPRFEISVARPLTGGPVRVLVVYDEDKARALQRADEIAKVDRMTVIDCRRVDSPPPGRLIVDRLSAALQRRHD